MTMDAREGLTLTPRRPGAIDRVIGARIAAERKAVGLSQRELGARLGFTPAQLHKYEIGASRIPAATLVALSQIIDVPVTQFLPNGAPGAKAATDCAWDIARHLRVIEDPDVLRALLEFTRAFTAARSASPRSVSPRLPPPETRSPCR